MGPAEWDQIYDLFHAAREKSGGERVLLLDEACGENTLLRKAVEELLKEDETASGFLSSPLFARKGEPLANRIVPGQRIEQYVTVASLGRGGMGEVWWARDMELERPVALKFLRSETTSESEAEQITREARAASALNHPTIVTIHEVVRSEGTVAIVMELVEGDSLGQFRGRPIPVPDVLAIAVQIGEALAAAHAGGIIHGDIKPENILLRQDHYVKVLDFGLARKITADTAARPDSPGLGTLRYLAPEQARGESLTPASDIFSFGLVLYELATGRHAFPGESPLDTARAILTKEPLPARSANPSVPARLDSLIGAMLAKDPAARPGAKDVVGVLNALQARGKIPLPSAWKWLIAASLLLLGCFVAWRWKQAVDARNAPSFRQITTLVPENRATAAAISPDGTQAAFANVDGIFLRRLDSGSTRRLRSPRDFAIDRLAWFADGKDLVAGGFSTATQVPSIWMISGNGASPRLLRTEARDASPSPDGKHIVFLSKDRSEIWVMGVDGERSQKVLTSIGKDTFELVFWSPDGHRLGFQWYRHATADTGNYETIALSTSKVIASGSDLMMSSACALPDGRLVFLKWDASLIASHELWEVKTDLRTGALLGTPRKIATVPGEGRTLLDLTITADGKRAMVLTRSDENTIFVGDFDQPPPRITNIRRLTLDERTNYPHAWTADSRAVIFESNRSGNFDLFKQDIGSRTPETIVATPLTEILPQLAPGGRSVLYAARPPEAEQPWYYKPGTYKLMRVPVEGGDSEEVPIGGKLDEFRCALGVRKRCVLRTTVGTKYFIFYDLDPIRGKGRELARTRWSWGVLGDWDVSPDGRYVAIPNHDSRGALIRVISLEQKPNEPQERDVVLDSLANLRGLVWAADGHGWFVSVDTSIGNRLLYVYWDGRFQPLGEIQGWAVPSPDGHRVAFLDRIVATNAWLIERH
ncbi:MAG: serine/threonine-protein kinase [Acidobacteriaceae bacterium]|nr:serine/threonine-protein kinase [Acidobacteriaceae bacterium]